jgi:hypothetical protein
MRKHVVAAAVFVVGIASAACEVQVGSGKPAQSPQPAPAAGAPATPATPANPATPAPAPGHKVRSIGRAKKGPSPVPTTPPPAPTAPATPPAGTGILTGTNVFGTGTPDPNGWKGSFFAIPAGTTTMPALASMTPTGVLFASSLNVTSKPMTGGFPGIDAAKNENFAIRWEAPLVVAAEADYTFRLVADDGAQLSIDGTLIVDDNGLAQGNAPHEASGPVHLIAATHAITVDYFQATGNVALQLYCTKSGGQEQICPTHL